MAFSGGGCPGTYEIGVWKAIKELNIDNYIQNAAGTSINVLNAVLFALKDYKLETVNKILYASSALSPVYGCEEIENVKYVDSGLP